MTLLVICYACQHMSFSEVAYSQFGKQKTGGLRQKNFRESFLQEMLHFGRVDNDKPQMIEFQAGSWGPCSLLSTPTCGFLGDRTAAGQMVALGPPD